jgi:hypothetical protein
LNQAAIARSISSSGKRVAIKNEYLRWILGVNEWFKCHDLVTAAVEVIEGKIFERFQGVDGVQAASKYERFLTCRSGSSELIWFDRQ